MHERRHVAQKSPDTKKLQEVVIDTRTKIYIAIDADPVEAKIRFLQRISGKDNIVLFARKRKVS